MDVWSNQHKAYVDNATLTRHVSLHSQLAQCFLQVHHLLKAFIAHLLAPVKLTAQAAVLLFETCQLLVEGFSLCLKSLQQGCLPFNSHNEC